MKFEFKNFKIRFHNRQVSFLAVETGKCDDVNNNCSLFLLAKK